MSKFQSLAEWAETPGGQEFMALSPDADLLAEISERDRRATAKRHPDQLSYDGPVALPRRDDGESKPTLYDLAKATVENRQAWSNGASTEIWRGKGTRVTVHAGGGRDRQGILILTFHHGVEKVAQAQCGQLHPTAPFWRFTLGRDGYARWIAKSKARGQHHALTLTLPEVTEEMLDDFSEGDLSPAYRKRARRARAATRARDEALPREPRTRGKNKLFKE